MRRACLSFDQNFGKILRRTHLDNDKIFFTSLENSQMWRSEMMSHQIYRGILHEIRTQYPKLFAEFAFMTCDEDFNQFETKAKQHQAEIDPGDYQRLSAFFQEKKQEKKEKTEKGEVEEDDSWKKRRRRGEGEGG